jgi:hypothetical protein
MAPRFGPREVDGFEFWECAVLLGVGPATGSDLIRQRIAAARGEGPEPEIPVTPPDLMERLPKP